MGNSRQRPTRPTRPTRPHGYRFDERSRVEDMTEPWQPAVTVRRRPQTPPRPTGSRRGGTRPSRPLTIVLALAGLLLTLSGVLEIAGAMPWPFNAAKNGVALVDAFPTPRPTKTPTPTPTPTIRPTPTSTPAVPSGPLYIPPPGSYDLGCGPRGAHALPYVVRSAPATSAVALTFDDGPSPDYTAAILTTLEQTHTPATFFVVGASVRSYPNLVAREARDGFAFGMHTWDHPFMTKLTPTARAWELTSTLQALHSVLGPNFCVPYWRPPFDDYNGDVLTLTQAMGLTTVTWNVDPQDWASPGVQVIVNRVLTYAQPGSIILLHDGYFNRSQTAQALPLIIKGLRARGLTLVTVPQLLAGGH
ncbi:MAG: polysaccharide deacetylase family protein [Ktedonobacterales bacterium]|nr:polysaccharide deacetylase family protein [Ktedonobacterales bacterium]